MGDVKVIHEDVIASLADESLGWLLQERWYVVRDRRDLDGYVSTRHSSGRTGSRRPTAECRADISAATLLTQRDVRVQPRCRYA